MDPPPAVDGVGVTSLGRWSSWPAGCAWLLPSAIATWSA